MIHSQTISYDLFGIIISLVRFTAANLTAIPAPGGLEGTVIDLAASATNPPSRKTENDSLVIDIEKNHTIQNRPFGRQIRIKRFRLRQGPGETVKQESPDTIGLFQAIGDHGYDKIVRNQLSCIHVLSRFDPEGRSKPDILPEDIPCRDMRDPVLFPDRGGLRSFPRPGGPEKNDLHRFTSPSD
jgi:hypothetical protein